MKELRLVPVLAGGGTRLPAHVGVLAALDELGIRYTQLVATSGGSIVAALHAAGWPPARLLDLALDVDFARFRGRSLIELVWRAAYRRAWNLRCGSTIYWKVVAS